MLQRTAKSCGPDAPMLASSARSRVGPTGLRQDLIRKRRWQKSPVTGESSKETVKTIACGNVGRFRCTRLLVCVLPIQSAREAAGATGTRRSPRPLLGGRYINGSGALRGEVANACLEFHVIASGAKQSIFLFVAAR